MPPADHVDDVTDDSACRRGDDADACGKGWKRTLPAGIKEAFGLEAGLELLKGKLQGSGSARLNGFGDELKLPARFVDRDPATHQNFQAVFNAEAVRLGLAPEEHDGKLRLTIFQREVDVAGGGGSAVGDLSKDGDIAIPLFQLASDERDQFGDRKRGATWRHRPGCRFSRLRRSFGLFEREAKLGSGVRGTA